MNDTREIGDFGVGDIISDTFNVLAKNFFKFFITAVIIYVPAMIIVSVIFGVDSLTVSAGAYSSDLTSPPDLLLSIIGYVATVSISYLSLEHMAGRERDVFKGVSIGLKYALFAFLIGLIITFFGIIGIFLLIIPGILVFVFTSVAIPVLVAEDKGVFGSLKRSIELTKGFRIKIFALFLVALIMAFIFFLVIGLVMAFGGVIGLLVGALVVYTVMVSFFSVLSTSLYVHLRTAKEGVDTSEIAKVFE
jgi:hypothetical protein